MTEQFLTNAAISVIVPIILIFFLHRWFNSQKSNDMGLTPEEHKRIDEARERYRQQQKQAELAKQEENKI